MEAVLILVCVVVLLFVALSLAKPLQHYELNQRLQMRADFLEAKNERQHQGD